MEYLSRNFQILSLKDGFAQVGTKSNGKPRVCITFDDGFENNLVHAAPILNSMGIPATVFVSSICVTGESDILWADAVDLILFERESVTVRDLTFSKTKGKFYCQDLGVDIHAYIKSRSMADRDAIIEELAVKYDLNRLKESSPSENWKLLSAEQLKDLANSSMIEIGSHCHYHYNLESLSSGQYETELSKSKQLLETCIGKKVDCIAFPDGSYNSDIKTSSYRIGYERLCAVSFKLEEDLSDNRILKRSAVSSTTSYASNVIHFYRNFRKDGN